MFVVLVLVVVLLMVKIASDMLSVCRPCLFLIKVG